MVSVSDILGPEVSLNTQNVLGLLLGQLLGQLIRVDTINGQETANAERLSLLISRLIVVEIEVRRGNHNHIVTQLGSLDTTLVATPRHHRSIGTNLTFENLVPTHYAATLLGEELLDAGHHVALQIVLSRVLVVVLQAQLFDLRLASGASAPTCLRALVATDVDQLRGEQFDKLLENTLQQVENLIVTSAEHLVRDTPTRPNLIRTTRATQLGIGCQSRHHMTRQVDLGNDLNGICGCILNDLTNLILSVVATVRNTIISTPILANYRMLTHRANLGQLGEALDLDTPALIVREVPMQAVELMHRHNVDVALDLLNREEVARNVEVHTTIAKTRSVLDRKAGHRPILIGSQRLAIDLGGQQLLDCLDCIVKTGELARANLNALTRYRKAIALLLNGRIDHKAEALRRHYRTLRSLVLSTAHGSQLIGKQSHRSKCAIVHRLVASKLCIEHRVATYTILNLIGIGNQRHGLVLGRASHRCDCRQKD